MPPKMRKKKDPFEELDSDFIDLVIAMSPEEINGRIAQVAKDEEENKRLMDEDQDLREKKIQVSEAAAQYKDSTRANRLRIKFLIQTLGDKGKA